MRASGRFPTTNAPATGSGFRARLVSALLVPPVLMVACTNPIRTDADTPIETSLPSIDDTGAAGSDDGTGRGREAELVRVVDGDSLEVRLDGEVVDVRLIGYNAPELFGLDADRGRDERTCNGEAARLALTELVEPGPVRLVGEETDRFGRLLADGFVAGRSVRVEMIGSGWGLATGDEPTDRDRMEQAAARGLGIWGDGCGAAAEPGLSLGETQIDPPGRDGDNLDQEWVTIVNRSGDLVDLEGWIIRDDTTSHRFLLDGVLQPGAVLTVRTGAGTSTGSDRYLGESFPVWSNGGDTVLLVDPEGVIAHWLFVG